jgi:hypothetical protein
LGGCLPEVKAVRSCVIHKPFAFGFTIYGFILCCPRP